MKTPPELTTPQDYADKIQSCWEWAKEVYPDPDDGVSTFTHCRDAQRICQ